MLTDNLIMILKVYLGLILLMIVTTCAQWVTLRLLRVRVEELQIFYGRKLLTRKCGNLKIVIGCIPTGFSLTHDQERFKTITLAARLSVFLVIPVVSLLGAATVLGIGPSLQQFLTGFRELLNGGVHPKTEGVRLIGCLFSYSGGELVPLISLLATKWAALSLLPIGFLPGQKCIHWLIYQNDAWKEVHAPDVLLGALGMLFFFSWILSCAFFVFR